MAASGTTNTAMAAEAAAEIVSQKLDVLLSCLERDGCSSMETLVKEAKKKLAKIREFLSDRDRPFESTEWSGRVLQAMYEAEEFIDKFHLRVARGRHEALHVATRPLATLVHKYMLWRDLSNLVKAMKELCQDQYLDKKEAGGERKEQPASSSSHASVPWEGKKLARLTNFWDRQAWPNFVCHETERTEIKKRLKKERYFVEGISIWGEQGAGKTFLARWVYREAMYLGFDTRAWVHVSACMDKKEFLLEILKQVDKLARGEMDFYEITKMLSQKLAKTKRFLIVLDDVDPADEDLLEGLLRIIDPFSWDGHLITTTQDEKMARRMDTGMEELKKLQMSDEEKGKMLAMKLRGGTHDPILTPEAKKEFLKQFPALPLCISLLGGLLSHATEREHEALAKNDTELSDILQLSYHRLPLHLKPCFIYMALFPVACPIPTRRLVRLWSAEGLLDSHCHDGERKGTLPEDVGEMFILELADRNVIDVVSWRADGSPKACQMLTSLYDMIRPIAMRTEFLHIHAANKSNNGNDRGPTGQQQQPTNVRWLAEHANVVRESRVGSYSDLKLGRIRSFLSFYLRRGVLTKDISTFLGSITSKTGYSLLRVLDLEGVYKPSLQGVLHKLVLLRYLGLRSTVLDSIPSEVADLHYLETLDMKHTFITSLPSSLWKARNLRHLHLNWFYIDLKKILKACSNNVMALTQLQTLSGVVIGEVQGHTMTAHMSSLTTLTTLKLFLQHSDNDTSGAAGEAVARWISSSLTNLQSLTFGVIQEAKPAEEAQPPKPDKPATLEIGLLPKLTLAQQHHQLVELYLQGQLNEPIWTQLLPRWLRVLTLSGSKVRTDMMPELGSLLRSLRTLRLLANSFLCESMTFAKDGFPSLKILKIWKLPNLQNVFIEEGAMPHLKELEFRHLDKMKDVKEIHHFTELQNVRVISRSKALFKQLKSRKEVKANLHFERDTERPASTDDDEDDRDEKGETEKDRKRREYDGKSEDDDDDSSDDDEESLP